jgi:hypothetical protein
VAVALGRLGVGVPGQVRDLSQIAELVGQKRHERLAQFVGRPVLARQPARSRSYLNERRRFDTEIGLPLRVQKTKDPTGWQRANVEPIIPHHGPAPASLTAVGPKG